MANKITYLILSPAYGRDYTSKRQVLQDFNDNKDFIIRNFNHPYVGKLINKEQVDKNTTIEFRYKRNKLAFTLQYKET